MSRIIRCYRLARCTGTRTGWLPVVARIWAALRLLTEETHATTAADMRLVAIRCWSKLTPATCASRRKRRGRGSSAIICAGSATATSPCPPSAKKDESGAAAERPSWLRPSPEKKGRDRFPGMAGRSAPPRYSRRYPPWSAAIAEDPRWRVTANTAVVAEAQRAGAVLETAGVGARSRGWQRKGRRVRPPLSGIGE